MLEEYNFEEWTDEDLKIGIELHITIPKKTTDKTYSHYMQFAA